MRQLMNHRQIKCLSVLDWRVQGPDHSDKSYMTLGLACRRQSTAWLSANFVLFFRLRSQVTLAKKIWLNSWACLIYLLGKGHTEPNTVLLQVREFVLYPS